MTETAVFDSIRMQCRRVAEQSQHVRIVEDHLDEFITPLLAMPLSVPELDTTSHFVDESEATIAFFTALAAVNFGSGYFPHLRKLPGLSGYYTVATHLTQRFRSQGPFTAVELAKITAQECAQLFGQDVANPDILELMGLFSASWNALGDDLLARFEGSFSALVRAAGHRASNLVEILARQPFFQDVSSYHGIDVPFYKRSQLLASDLCLALNRQGLGRFDDLDELTIFADNLVPHVLRLEGILDYSPSLARGIEKEELIPAGSDEEIEIRACSVHAVELMIDVAAEAGVAWSARDVDQLLWHQGQRPEYKKKAKRHRTRTVFY